MTIERPPAQRHCPTKLSRRAWLCAAGSALGTVLPLGAAQADARKPATPRQARLESAHFTLRDIQLPGERSIGQRMVMLLPRHTRAKLPLLVLLHGLGETGDQRTGAYAWLERYGLGSCYERLLSPPIKPLARVGRHWTRKRLEVVNQQLAKQPFRGLAIACPYTPNVYKAQDRSRTLDRYADWITSEVIPRAQKEANVFSDRYHTYLDGCSLGGYVGIEVFLRKPEHFCAWGAVQGALGAHRVAGYAARLEELIAKHGPRHIHLESSSADPFLADNRRLSAALTKRHIKHDLIVPPGPHNQPFLRDSGTLEMLLWHARGFANRRPRRNAS